VLLVPLGHAGCYRSDHQDAFESFAEH
jgi:hypothetical protein